MSAPRIGLSAYPRVVDIVTGPTLLQTANRFYVDSVVAAGGMPIVLPVVDPDLASSALAGVQGLVLTGGGDVEPACYGETAQPETGTTDAGRDAWEIALVRAALQRRMPMLATCRGSQVLNVALGGTLVQDVSRTNGSVHGMADRYGEPVHPVCLAPDSQLASLLCCTELSVNSIHHQAVGTAGTGVRAVGWAPDGTVEAIEVEGHPEVIGVQWHPELLGHDPLHLGLFRWLVGQIST